MNEAQRNECPSDDRIDVDRIVMHHLPTCSDPLYVKAVDLARERGEVSVSMLQRNFFIGYNRSRILLEAMENSGMLETQAAERGCLYKFVGAQQSDRQKSNPHITQQTC